MNTHRIIAANERDTVYFTRLPNTGEYLLEIHENAGDKNRVSFVSLSQDGARELAAAILATIVESTRGKPSARRYPKRKR